MRPCQPPVTFILGPIFLFQLRVFSAMSRRLAKALRFGSEIELKVDCRSFASYTASGDPLPEGPPYTDAVQLSLYSILLRICLRLSYSR